MTILRMIGQMQPSSAMPSCGRWPCQNASGGLRTAHHDTGETGLVRKGFRKLRHKLTLILPIGWRLILLDLIETKHFLNPFPGDPVRSNRVSQR